MGAASGGLVQAYGPELEKRCRPSLKPTLKSYRVDETYIRIKGKDRDLYRAVDKHGQTIDFLLTARRDARAAKRFLRKALPRAWEPSPAGHQRGQESRLPGRGRSSQRRGRIATPVPPAPVQVLDDDEAGDSLRREVLTSR
jgi:transposase, IS6 family